MSKKYIEFTELSIAYNFASRHPEDKYKFKIGEYKNSSKVLLVYDDGEIQ